MMFNFQNFPFNNKYYLKLKLPSKNSPKFQTAVKSGVSVFALKSL